MKTRKMLQMALILVAMGAMIFQGCKKDDDSSSGNYFAIDGARYDLSKCYVSKRINNDVGHQKEDNYDVFFASSGISIDSMDTQPKGSGDAIFAIISSNISETGIETGDYIYNGDETLSTTYSECAYLTGYSSVADTAASLGTTDLLANLKVVKSGDTYQFTYDGKTAGGKTFAFRYNGSMITMPPHEVK